ncbi:methylenetetrahydrofolate reductase [NAD(P)H] [Kushneria phosphatilytica]|uniref:Methylenetetrahydrofolate reductase n=1 Tax=Kushneria phosphatilytica TaxID=657387 RepID=A0A1S1NU95_9GAMM|nr:methylenetetrahydrofolate reductase [NAD(P)H] [Kushneria phosphatilytica]OHV09330.1 methylenetetrahydrofolate reductase [NAD(P)H] [Kushneria phosphatilytica]QEL12293.1 methylenetetrahydrofolate reductase [NAD(P)H] [Kushneria phosphatilytica]
MTSTAFHTSFEFFPPRTEAGRDKLMGVRDRLVEQDPSFFSVTFGAGGSTREPTFDTVCQVRETGINTAPHLSCVASDKASLRDLLHRYQEAGISRIVALRGDMPSGTLAGGELRYARDLVDFIRHETGDHFRLSVAAYPECHPQASSFEQDIDHFVDKVRAGADMAITQYFFNAEAYFHFVEQVRRRGVDVPIVPGIMPITNFTKLARFSDMCGADIPRWIRRQLEAYGDDSESIRAFGEEVVSTLCQRLVEGGAPGLHFYTLNQADASLAILGNLGLGQRQVSAC